MREDHGDTDQVQDTIPPPSTVPPGPSDPNDVPEDPSEEQSTKYDGGDIPHV